MPRFPFFLARRAGPLGMALTLWDVWRRLPPKQRQRLMQAARTHGPRVARRAYDSRRRPR